MANITKFDNENKDKGYCEKCGVFFTYNGYVELFSESKIIYKFGKSYLHCPVCRTKIYKTYGSIKNNETGETHYIFEY